MESTLSKNTNLGLRICEELLKRSLSQIQDSSVQFQNRRSTVAFQNAAKIGNLALIKLFITNFKDKNPKDKEGMTPLHFAAENGHLSICQLLLEKIGKYKY